MALSGAAVAYSVIGGLVLYSGIKGATISDTVKAALKGNINVTNTEPITPAQMAQIDSQLAQVGNVSKGQAAAMDYAKSQMSKYGWNYQDYLALTHLWEQESGWSNTAKNPTSGAYGIAQALGHAPGATVAQNMQGDNYPNAAANPPPWGTSDPQAQIDWGLQYIQQTYQSPSMAWAHEQQNGWY